MRSELLAEKRSAEKMVQTVTSWLNGLPKEFAI